MSEPAEFSGPGTHFIQYKDPETGCIYKKLRNNFVLYAIGNTVYDKESVLTKRYIAETMKRLKN